MSGPDADGTPRWRRLHSLANAPRQAFSRRAEEYKKWLLALRRDALPSTLKRMDLSAPSATPTVLEVLSASAALPAARRILGRSPSDEIDMVDSAPAPAGPAANQPAAAMELTSTGLRCAAAAGSRAIEGIIIDGER